LQSNCEAFLFVTPYVQPLLWIRLVVISEVQQLMERKAD